MSVAGVQNSARAAALVGAPQGHTAAPTGRGQRPTGHTAAEAPSLSQWGPQHTGLRRIRGRGGGRDGPSAPTGSQICSAQSSIHLEFGGRTKRVAEMFLSAPSYTL